VFFALDCPGNPFPSITLDSYRRLVCKSLSKASGIAVLAFGIAPRFTIMRGSRLADCGFVLALLPFSAF
jgi:hypothetical protein